MRVPSPLPAVLALVLGALGLVSLGPDRSDVGLALLPWSIAFVALIRFARSARPVSMGTVLGVGLALRAVFLLTDTDLSDDLFRYVWDGWIGVSMGVPPYQFAPSDPALASAQSNPLFERLNSPDFISVYPPLSQLTFLIGGWVHEHFGWPASGRVIRFCFTLLEAVGLVLLSRTGIRARSFVLYAWNPLIPLVVAGSGHSEGGLILGFGLLLFGISRQSPALGWIGWVLSVLSKGFPLLAFPLVWRALTADPSTRQGGRSGFMVPTRRPSPIPSRIPLLIPSLVPALALGLALTALFLRPGDFGRIASSTDLYVQFFEFNSGIHAVLKAIGWVTLGSVTDELLGPALRGVAVLGALWVGIRHPVSTAETVARGLLVIFTIYLATATTIHPWYLLWVVPFIPFTTTLRWPWIWASWASLSTYLVYSRDFALHTSILFWGGFFLLLAHEERERLLRPLRRVAAQRKARWIAPHLAGFRASVTAADPASPRLPSMDPTPLVDPTPLRVLDLGGGEGWVGDALFPTPNASRVILLDPGAERRGAVRGDGASLPFASGTFDGVLLSFVLHHTEDAEGTLREALRVSRGRVVLLESVYTSRVEQTLLRWADRWVNAERGTGAMGRPDAPLAFRTTMEWKAMAARLGARIVHADFPGGTLHQVLLLVLEPPAKGGGERLA
jgi:alpha-1,6-mannosyltransferase